MGSIVCLPLMAVDALVLGGNQRVMELPTTSSSSM